MASGNGSLPLGVEMVPVASLKPHPDAGRIPEMRPEEFDALVADIQERQGVRTPLELLPGTKTILDGRSRWGAAKAAGLKAVPCVHASINGDDPVVYMIRSATRRRHLSDGQRAMLAEEERAYLAEKGKASRTAKLAPGPGRGHRKNVEAASAPTFSEPDAPSPQPSPLSTGEREQEKPVARAREVAAKAHNVSEHKVRQAQIVREHSPTLAEKVKRGDVPLPQAVREVQRAEKSRQLAERAAKVAASDATAAAAGFSAPPRPWAVITGDCLKEMARLRDAGRQFRLIFADPPYNQGVDYGAGAKADKLDDAAYLDWCERWFGACASLLTDDGSLWVLISADYAADFNVRLRQTPGLHLRQWIIWYESFGVYASSGRRFSRCHRHLFWMVRDPKRYVFNPEAVTRPSDRQLKYQDKRADPNGKVWDDVWGINPPIPRLVDNAAERIPEFPTQLPLALLRPIVGVASDAGDEVLDPFSGSATTGVACVELGRRYTGIEKSANYAGLSTLRLKAASAERKAS